MFFDLQMCHTVACPESATVFVIDMKRVLMMCVHMKATEFLHDDEEEEEDL